MTTKKERAAVRALNAACRRAPDAYGPITAAQQAAHDKAHRDYLAKRRAALQSGERWTS